MERIVLHNCDVEKQRDENVMADYFTKQALHCRHGFHVFAKDDAVLMLRAFPRSFESSFVSFIYLHFQYIKKRLWKNCKKLVTRFHLPPRVAANHSPSPNHPQVNKVIMVISFMDALMLTSLSNTYIYINIYIHLPLSLLLLPSISLWPSRLLPIIQVRYP